MFSLASLTGAPNGSAAHDRRSGSTRAWTKDLDYARLLKTPTSIYVSILIVHALSLVLPLVILQVYDRVIPNASTETMLALFLIVLAAILIDSTLKICRAYIDSVNSAQFAHNISVDAISRILHSPDANVFDEPAQRTSERLEKISKLGGVLGSNSQQVMIDLPFSLLFLLAIGFIGGWIVLVPISLAVVFGVMTYWHGKQLERIIQGKDEQDRRIFDFIAEILEGISTIKGLSSEPMMLRRFERLEKGSARWTFDLITASDRAQVMASTLGNLTIAAVVSVGALMAINGYMTIGTIAACSMLAGRALQPAMRVAGTWNELQRVKLTMNEAKSVVALPAPDYTPPENVAVEPPAVLLSGIVPNRREVAQDYKRITFAISPGELVCVSGPDGAGKSTIARMIAGLEAPDRGEVRIDGVPAMEYRDTLVNSIGYVSPDTEVFKGSILDNLTVFGTACDHDSAIATSRLLGLDDHINRLPAGYQTKVGASATESMAKGFIQRILVGRAMAQWPGLLILDEADTFLDDTAHSKFREFLLDLKGTVTTILTTDRDELQSIADVTLHLDRNGFVRSTGKRSEEDRTNSQTIKKSRMREPKGAGDIGRDADR